MLTDHRTVAWLAYDMRMTLAIFCGLCEHKWSDHHVRDTDSCRRVSGLYVPSRHYVGKSFTRFVYLLKTVVLILTKLGRFDVVI